MHFRTNFRANFAGETEGVWEMASNTMATWHKRKRAHKNLGRKRKNAEARHSTASKTELFAGLGEPGQPVDQPVKK
jgi:hypothetical protein